MTNEQALILLAVLTTAKTLDRAGFNEEAVIYWRLLDVLSKRAQADMEAEDVMSGHILPFDGKVN